MVSTASSVEVLLTPLRHSLETFSADLVAVLGAPGPVLGIFGDIMKNNEKHWKMKENYDTSTKKEKNQFGKTSSWYKKYEPKTKTKKSKLSNDHDET